MRRALVTGITGQDGAYLAKLLLGKGYKVYGAKRRNSTPNTWRLEALEIENDIEFIELELLEFSNVLRAVDSVGPDEVYNFAAQSFVAPTFEQPIYTTEVNTLGVARLLEAIRTVNPKIRFYQASTSEMFGNARECPQDERTPFYPRSPYGVSKLAAHWLTVNYREAHGLHATSGILFNHESPLRGEEFVTRRICKGLAKIASGEQEFLTLGNVLASRDWGYAPEYVEGIYRMVQKDEPGDYVLATGETYTIAQFATWASEVVGMDLIWDHQGSDTTALDRKSGRIVIRTDPALYRPAEVDRLQGDCGKAKRDLGWNPSVFGPRLVQIMMDAELNGRVLPEAA